ncbi:unnamed protein product, partial [Laminaria digitata]
MTRHRRTAAAVGLCLATATTTPGLAFQLHAARGIATAGRSGRGDHDLGGRRSAACRHAVRDDGHDGERRRSQALQQESSESPPPSSPRGADGRGGRPGGSKDVAALMLSALLLGNPQLSDAAATTTAAASTGGVDTATQNRLIADLEKKLTSLQVGAGSDHAPPTQASPEASTTSASEQQASTSAESRRTQNGATTASPESSAATTGAQQSSQQAQAAAAAAAAGAGASAAAGASSQAAAGAYTVGALGSIGGKPMLKLQEYTFSVKLPELNLPPVGPITVPAEGGLFGAPGSAGKVEAMPGLPGGEAV